MTRPATRGPLLVLVATALPAVAAAPREPKADPPGADAVRAAYAAYAAALASGDASLAKRYAVADPAGLALIDRVASAVAVERQFRAAVEGAFPNALPSAPATRPSSASTVALTGDTATLTPIAGGDVIKLRRDAGEWKVDLNATFSPDVLTTLEQYGNALRDTMTALTADVAAGKFKTYADVQSELETRIKMRLASPEGQPTTRPAT